jgi:hypothetical protein
VALASLGARSTPDAPPPARLADAGADARPDAASDAAADARFDARPDARPDAGKPPPVPPCVKVQSQAIYSGGAYDHVVSIENGCQRDADCEVRTDVSEETLSVSVPPGENRDVVTYRGSPSSEFKADVTCKLRK